MKSRVQCSLLFDDLELYNEFVLPMKESRQLNPLIARLLGAYWRSDEVRGIVDGDAMEEDVSSTQQREEMFYSINETLAVMEFMAEEGKNIIGDGSDIVETILSGAESSGMATHVEDDVGGGGFTRFNVPKALPTQSEEEEQATESSVPDSEFSILKDKVESMENVLLNMQDMMTSLLSGSVVIGSNAKNSEVSDTEALLDEPMEEQVEESASDDMMALLGSLG